MSKETTALSSWRFKGMGILRIVFGLVWAVDAWFKWQPDFIHNFESYLTGGVEGQPPVVHAWVDFWVRIINVNPHVFAYLTAVGETAIAIGLIFGLFSNLTYVVGVLLSVVIWSTAEGFGGPYTAGSTDIGAAIIYVLVFAGLYLAKSGLSYGLDGWVAAVLERIGLGKLSCLASGRVKQSETASRSALSSN